ncbi:MAG TPA: hypothetical protein PKZ41_03105, partial [Candidatus Omnitrophota bacterium]|nr:hypothetical protein [Candidatus Omnitrophota bacterium]
MKLGGAILFFSFLAVIFIFSGGTAFGQDEDIYKAKVVVKTVSGVKFQVPEDMPIVRRNNTLMSLPTDEYVYWKFSKFEERVAAIEDRINRNEEEVNVLSERA